MDIEFEQNKLIVNHAMKILDQENIKCEIKNGNFSVGEGEDRINFYNTYEFVLFVIGVNYKSAACQGKRH